MQRLFCPVGVVYVFLLDFLQRHDLALDWVNDMPLAAEADHYVMMEQEAAPYMPLIAAVADRATPVSQDFFTALLQGAYRIHGQTGGDKIATFAGIFASAPRGDVVEIGVLAGRSAYGLAVLGAHYEMPAMVVIDPWTFEDLRHETSAELVFRFPYVDFDKFRRGFIMNLRHVMRPPLAMLHTTSHDAYDTYRQAPITISSEAFGSANLTGKIGVIHIDGNHDEAAVVQDCEQWLPHVLADGWVILDDYIWAHGDGPQLAGDRLLARYPDHIKRVFVIEKGLFIQLSKPLPRPLNLRAD
ncbi:MAG: class I SAM-dependent methyltransferase [Pseudomonadota bacterium]